ncbi:MAG TPA: transcriptional regulator [Planctomycetes bacterium]|nr:transcriptional regulator [Planctomycetota bacterium]
MSTGNAAVDRILTQLAPLQVRARAMFGGYGVYCDDKFVISVCYDRGFLKETPAIQAAGLELRSSPPYPGAKLWPEISEELMLDRTELRKVVQATADLLPAPKSKRPTLSKRAAKK